MTITEKYRNARRELDLELRLLRGWLVEHRQSQRAHPDDWGYVGDILHVLRTIRELRA